MNQSLKRIRLGNIVIGLRINTSNHKLSGQFMLGHVADTMGILNRFKNTNKQCLFADFDNCNSWEAIQETTRIAEEIGDTFMFESSPNHYNIISTALIDPIIIQQILMESPLVDSKFKWIYFKFKDNTIKILDKYVSGKPYRKIKFKYHAFGNNNAIHHRDLLIALTKIYPEIVTPKIEYMINELDKTDASIILDLITKRYETVNW